MGPETGISASLAIQSQRQIALLMSWYSSDLPERLPEIVKGYELKDIWNADETGLFLREEFSLHFQSVIMTSFCFINV